MNQMLLFVAVGGFAAVVNVLCRVGFSGLMPFEWAVVLAYVFGMVTAYFLNRVVVFTNSGGATMQQFGRFVLVNLAALVVVWAVSVGLLRFVFPWIKFNWHADIVAHGIGVASPMLCSYLLHRNFTFKS
jgi:putative flippase GtrA